MSSGSTPFKIALAGFNESEAASLSTFFRLAVRSQPGYQIVGLPQQADIVIADGANTPVLRQLKSLRLRCQVLLIGASEEFPHLPFETRPLRLAAVLRAVEYLLGVFDPGAAHHQTPAMDDAHSTQPPPHAWAAATAPQPLSMVKGPAPQVPSPVAGPGAGSHAPAAFAATQPMTPSGAASPAAAFAATQPAAAFAATQPMTHGLREGMAYAATEPAPLGGFGSAADGDGSGFAATQPMAGGYAGAAFGTAPVSAEANPWRVDGGISDDELRAFRGARRAEEADASAAIPAPAEPSAAPRVEVPVGAGRADAPPSHNSFIGLDAGPAVSQAAPAKGPGVLLLDDSDIDARRIERALADAGLAMVRARTAPDALARLAQRPFALVLVDTALDGGGFGHCRALRQQLRAHGQTAPVVALVRAGGAFDRLRARLAGCEATLVKPVNLALLEKLVDELVPEPPAAPSRDSRRAG